MTCHSASQRLVSVCNTAVKIKKKIENGRIRILNEVLEKKSFSKESWVTVGRVQTAGRHLNISICEFS